MAYPVHTPRVNNNDDWVRVVDIAVKVGDSVKRGDVVAAVETDKAVVEVEADRDGYVLKILAEVDEQAAVGSVFLWLGESRDEPAPAEVAAAPVEAVPAGSARPTAKARALLKELGLDAARIPVSGERLSVADIEAYLDQQGAPAAPVAEPKFREQLPLVAGELQDLSPEGRGMLSTVLWHRDQAAHGYLELEYDPQPWEAYAKAYAETHKLMLSPVLPLLAYRLVDIVRGNPRLNATVVNGRRYQYQPVNLGFTVQADQTLYLTVLRDTQDMSVEQFIAALGEIQRQAMGHTLKPEQMSGATVAFSSMARWNISRHIPILPPYTSLMIAHAAPRGTGRAVLGASYDHRLLSGFDVAQVLQALTKVPT